LEPVENVLVLARSTDNFVEREVLDVRTVLFGILDERILLTSVFVGFVELDKEKLVFLSSSAIGGTSVVEKWESMEASRELLKCFIVATRDK
jgi:hypothetical protein